MKELDTQQTIQMIQNLLQEGLGEEAAKLEDRLRKTHPQERIYSHKTEIELAKFITVHPKMLELKQHIRILSLEDDPVLIIGETGTGKEILAKSLHGSRGGPYESINCASIPEQLLESILFGHKAGSFTDAKEDKIGLMQYCFNGTLHLDEIGEMPILMQGKLLRALQEKKIRRIGDNKEIDINCRIVASTNKSLHDNVGFRKDLFWRLGVFVFHTLPLSARPEDVKLILQTLDAEKKIPTERIVELCKSMYDCDGNVRTLQALVRRYYVLGDI